MSAGNEFDYGDELPRGGGRRFSAALVALVFAGAIFGTATVDSSFPVPPAKLLGAEKAERDLRRRTASLRDGSLARVFEDDLRERSRVRAKVLPPYAFFKYAALGEGTEEVLVGAQDWIFLRNRVELASFDEEWLASLTTSLFAAVDRRLASRGLDLVVIPIPRKAWVAREFLPRGVRAQLDLDDHLIDGLLDSGVPTADLRSSYRERNPEEIYFKADTHWTPTGAWLAAEEAARIAFPRRTPEGRLGEVEVSVNTASRQKNDLLRALGMEFSAEDLGMLEFRDPLRYTLRLPDELEAWYGEPTPEAPLGLSGTSFSHQQRLARSITHFAGQPVYDGARPAAPFLHTANLLLRANRDAPRLRCVFIEYPIGMAYNQMDPEGGDSRARFGPAAGQLFADVAPEAVEVLSEIPARWRPAGVGSVDLGSGPPTRLLEVPAGFLAHSGLGLAGVRLVGEVEGAAVDLELIHADHILHVKLAPGEVSTVLPLIAAGATSSSIQVAARAGKPASLRIDSLALVHESAPGVTVALQREPRDAALHLRPEASCVLGRRAALLASLGNGLGEGGALRVQVFTSESEQPRTYRFEQLEPGARLLLDLGGARGEELLRVELSAPGATRGESLAGAARVVGAN